MNKIKWLIGSIYLKLRNAGEGVEIERYKKKLLHCGKNVHIGRNCRLIPEHIRIGDNVRIGEGAYLMSSVSYINIGSNVVMGPGVIMRGGDHRFDIIGRYIIDVKETDKLPENDQDIIICDDVWIGQGVTILKGVTIGEGSVIGAGAVVTKNVPPYTIYLGVHAPYEKPRFTAEQIRKHKEILHLRK